jgi:hypothetical protein
MKNTLHKGGGVFTYNNNNNNNNGARGGAVVEALRYKPEGRGIIPDGVIGIFR